MELRLNPEERNLLACILNEHLRELLLQISHATHHDFKVELRKKAAMVEDLLSRLRVSETKVA